MLDYLQRKKENYGNKILKTYSKLNLPKSKKTSSSTKDTKKSLVFFSNTKNWIR